MVKRTRWMVGFILFGLLGCGQQAEPLFLSGRTMGTTWSVRAISDGKRDVDVIRKAVTAELSRVNAEMSTWQEESEISRFNRLPEGTPQTISSGFAAVMGRADWLWRVSSGAWDPTILPLVDLWGFGPKGRRTGTPTEEEIRKAMGLVGFPKIRVDGHRIGKRASGVRLDLSSIAKGHGVDRVAERLESLGLEQYLVEIGGEIRVAGGKGKGIPWVLGINRPEVDAPVNAVFGTLSLMSGSLATSGNYRNFVETEDGRFGHILDPRIGRPVRTRILSASVVAPTCMDADGLATALLVLGEDAAIRLMDALPDAAAFLILGNADGSFRTRASQGFPEVRLLPSAG